MSAYFKKESYSIGEVARVCQVNVVQVMDWFRLRKIQYFETPGGHLRVSLAALEHFLITEHLEKPSEWRDEWAKFKVLLVEDEADLREILMELLKDEPRIEACCEGNGFDGLLKVTSWKPDLVLLDFLMPGMNGFEVCRRLRANPSFRDLPVLALTSLCSNENKHAVYQAGVSDYLKKPFRGEMLLEKVRTLLGLDLDAKMRAA